MNAPLLETPRAESAVTSTPRPSRGDEPSQWMRTKEVGSVRAMRLMLRLCQWAGRGVASAVLPLVCCYYLIFAPRLWRPILEFHRNLAQSTGEGGAAGRSGLRRAWVVYRQLRTFAQCLLDRVFLLGGRMDLFEIERTGSEHIFDALEGGRGAILLGAHLGSFEAMRAVAAEHGVRVNVLAYTENAGMIKAVLDEVGAGEAVDVIEVDKDDATYLFRVLEAVERGELVALFADRVGLNERSAEVEFLGEPTVMPTGPYVLAALLKCPVLVVAGLFEAPNRYSLHCRPFADRVVLPRGRRDDALAAYAQAFAEHLEEFAKLAPRNWFNFFPFWRQQ